MPTPSSVGLSEYGIGGYGMASDLSLDLLDMNAVSSRMSALRAQAALLANAQQRLQDDMRALELLIADQQHYYQERQQQQQQQQQHQQKGRLEGQQGAGGDL